MIGTGQGVFVSLDDFDLGGWSHPQVTLLGVDAVVAGADGFDLGQFHFVDKSPIVAVAAVCLAGLVCVGYGCWVFADLVLERGMCKFVFWKIGLELGERGRS